MSLLFRLNIVHYYCSTAPGYGICCQLRTACMQSCLQMVLHRPTLPILPKVQRINLAMQLRYMLKVFIQHCTKPCSSNDLAFHQGL